MDTFGLIFWAVVYFFWVRGVFQLITLYRTFDRVEWLDDTERYTPSSSTQSVTLRAEKGEDDVYVCTAS